MASRGQKKMPNKREKPFQVAVDVRAGSLKVKLIRKSTASRAKWQLKDAEISKLNSKVGN